MTSTPCKTLVALMLLAVVGCGGMQQPKAARGPASLSQNSGVGVYYMHQTFRCPTCLKIENMARQVVQERFAGELAAGTVRWDAVNYLEQDGAADRYGLRTSSLVVVTYQDGREVSHEVLNETWALYPNPAQFEAYVVEAVRKRLGRK